MKSDQLKLRLLEAARAAPAPVREPVSRRRQRAVQLLAVSAAAMTAVVFASGGPGHAAGRPFGATAALLGTALAAALGASWFALPARRSMLPRPRWLLLAVTVSVPVLVGLSLSLGHLTYADPFERFGWRCFAMTLGTAPGPLAALLFFGRRLDPVHPRFTGAAIGAAAAAWGAVMVEIWCPLARPDHVLFGHVAPIVLLAAAGALAGQRLFGLERR